MQAALIMLPIVVFGVLSLICARRVGVTEAFVRSYLLFLLFIVVSTEVLSIFQAICFPVILSVWLLLLMGLLIWLGAVPVPSRKQNASPCASQLSLLMVLLFGVIVFTSISTFAAAILYPPNTWDSMTYHMARVVHWIDNHSVSFYPTAVIRQLYMMPLTEFAVMHFQILSDGDFFANLVQWVSFMVAIGLAPLISAEFGLDKEQRIVSAVIVATLPMAILQASSTQNDLAASSLVMSFALFMLRIRERFDLENSFFAAISLGLALLTKGTAYMYCATVGITLTVPILVKTLPDRTRCLKRALALSAVVTAALVLNVGHLWRNFQLFGHPLSTQAKDLYNEDFGPDAIAYNIATNVAIHLGTPFNCVNKRLYQTMQALFGKQLVSPKTNFNNTFFMEPIYSRHEVLAGNLIHALLALACMLYLPIAWCRRRHCRTMWYALGIWLGAVAYCCCLKCQPWASRLHTPLFALIAPLLAIVLLSVRCSIRRYIGFPILFCMMAYSLPFSLDNETRPLLSREWYKESRTELYFWNIKEISDDYREVIDYLHRTKVHQVGLHIGEDDWEYPFWVIAKQTQNDKTNISFRHLGVINVSRVLERDDFLPQYVIATRSMRRWKYATMYKPQFVSKHYYIIYKQLPKSLYMIDFPK